MRVTRREWLALTGAAGLGRIAPPARPDDRLNRIARVIAEYESQGYHRTATEVDRLSADWLTSQIRDAGLPSLRETFPVDRVDPIDAHVELDRRTIEGLPLFDGGFTDRAGVRGPIGLIGSDASIGLVEVVPNATAAIREARLSGRLRAIVAVTRGTRPGLCPSNAESFLQPFGPPVVQVSSIAGEMLARAASSRSDVRVVASVKRTAARADNIVASVEGADRAAPPIVVMTPRSGWWTCASERGGGLACWLEVLRAIKANPLRRTALFVASTGHEIGYRGIEVFIERRPGLAQAAAWLHFGANIGAATDPSNMLQASDEAMDRVMTEAMTASGLSVDRRAPRSAVPAGEAGVVSKAGGRFFSIIGRSALFHNPDDRGPQAVDVGAVAAFADAFTAAARTLAAS